MSLIATLFSRIAPVFLMVAGTFLVPWVAKLYLIAGINGQNFQQSDMGHCEVIHQDTLIGCEDLHVYNAESGPIIFTGCAEKLSDQFVPPFVRIGV
jgi:hypothetical protein